jgi:hypothetical protein
MQTVLFSVRKSANVQSVLAAINRLLKAPRVHPLYPDSDNPERETEFFAALDDRSDVEAFARKLRELPEVADVELPVQRHLVR